MKIKVWAVLLIVGVLSLLFAVYSLRYRGAEKEADVPANVPTYFVYKADRKVLKIQDSPGYLMSSGYLPPGQIFPQHPFVNAQSLDPFEEAALRKILLTANDFAGFVALLEKSGYTVKKED